MIFEEYVPLAMRTNPKGKSFNDNLLNACLGLAGEYSEYVNAKTLGEKKDELSDLHWYTGLLAKTLHVEIDEDIISEATLLTTIGGICDYVKKHSFQGHTLVQDVVDIMVSNLLNCLRLECLALETTPSEIMEKNIAKLRKRYPQGFEVEKSVNRVD